MYHLENKEIVLMFVRCRVRVILKNRGTIVVLERYGLALCFLEVFGWWYYSGTSGVRMRYAVKFRCAHNFLD